MTKITSLSISALLGLCLLVAPAQPGQAAVGDPELILYRFPGVTDNGGGANSGVATVFHCTNFSGVAEHIRFVTRRFDGFLLNNSVLIVDHLRTFTAATHPATMFGNEGFLNTGPVLQGTTAIAATSINVICTAMIVDAASPTPVGVSLRGIRFNPAPGSQE
jgi:hypothetical protein